MKIINENWDGSINPFPPSDLKMEKMREKFAVSNAPTYHARVRLLIKSVERDEENDRILKSNFVDQPNKTLKDYSKKLKD